MAPRVLALSLALSWLMACAGIGSRSRETSERDEAAGLVARLPTAAKRCVAARVERLAPARRLAFDELSASGPLAFEPHAPIIAYALAEDRGGIGASFEALFRTSASPRVVRAYFEASRGARLGFDEGVLCEAESCRPVEIEFVEPTLLRVRSGTLLGGAEGAPARCAALLRAHPEAVEVAAGIDEGAAEDGHASRVLEREWVAEADDRGLRVARVERYGDARAAETAAVLESALPREGGFIHVADPLERVARGTEVRFEAAVTYDDLALRAQDVARLERAMKAEMAFAWRLIPIADIDVHRFEVVDRQVYVRRQRLEVASPEERLELSRELVALLDEALVVHPSQERLAEIRYEVLLRFLGDGPGAVRTAELALEAHPDDRQTWLARRREALIAFDLHGAGEALEEARVAGQGRGRLAAGALRALLEGAKTKDAVPVSYPLAEAALATAERIASFTADERLAAPVLVEWHALAETAIALFELRGLVEPSDRLLALVRGSLPSGTEAPPSFVELERGRGLGRRLGLAPVEGRGWLRAFGRDLERAAGDGAITVLFALVGAGAPRETPVIALRGRPSDRGLQIEAAHGPVASWSRVFRLLTEPLARMHPFHRPAPAFIVEPSGEEERHALLERIGAVREIACGGDETSLACRSTLSGSALRRAWVHAVGPLVDDR